jgi:hypothetical protein
LQINSSKKWRLPFDTSSSAGGNEVGWESSARQRARFDDVRTSFGTGRAGMYHGMLLMRPRQSG